jgi:hypothetical protein
MKTWVLFLAFTLCATTAAGNAVADEIAWLYIQHREYGGGAGLNRLSFGLVDEEANYVTGKDAVDSVELIDPSGC